jgi:hypothetical protein
MIIEIGKLVFQEPSCIELLDTVFCIKLFVYFRLASAMVHIPILRLPVKPPRPALLEDYGELGINNRLIHR